MRKKDSYPVMFYAIIMMVMAVAELFFDFKWLNLVMQISFYLVLFALTALVCLKASKCDKRIEVLIYIILISTAILNGNLLIFISGIAVIVYSYKKVRYTSRLVMLFCTFILVTSTVLFGLIDGEYIDERVVAVDKSPNETYVIEQMLVNASVAGSGIRVIVYKEFCDIIEISYKIQLNDKTVDINWINETTFTIDGELMEVKF